MTLATALPPVGIQPDHQEAEFFARNGNVCEGYIYPMCFLQHAGITSDGLTPTFQPGSEASMWANVSASAGQAANEGRDGRWVLALTSALDTTKFKGVVKGFGRAVVADVQNGTIPRGRKLWPGPAHASGSSVTDAAPYHLESSNLTGTAGIAKHAIAQMMDPSYSTTPSDGTTAWVYFDGFDGVNLSGETQ